MSGWRNIVGVAASLFLIASFGILGFAMASLPAPREEKRVAGLPGPAQALFDAEGVPYIFAPDLESAAFALGYAHARDRMWQMELQRRLVQGRLSELFGERSLAIDRQYRTLGLYRAAEDSVAALDDDVRRHLQAYADGINAWLADHDGADPIEFTVLNHRPEPWRPADSVGWAKVMAMRLSGNYQGELLRLRLSRRLPLERIEELWPPYPADGPVTVAMEGSHSSEESRPPAFALKAPALAPEDLPRGASNVWAVAGVRTMSGKPILANDPHLGFAAPIIWYLARIVTPDGELTGGTIPGLPYAVVGHNGRLAWGITATQSDLQDAVLERLTDDTGQRYDTPDGPRPFIEHVESIAVKSKPDVTLTVRETRHGPVVAGDPLPLGDGRSAVVALQATFLSSADTSVQALYRMNRAATREQFIAALADAVSPQLNFVFADVDGGIGYYAPGRVPIRGSGNGFYARRGWVSDDDWKGFVPFAELPQLIDPPDGVIVNANNRAVGGGYPYFLSRDWESPFRAERILALLNEPKGASRGKGRGARPLGYEPQDAVRMQSDDLSLMARKLLPLMTTFEPEAPMGRRIISRMRTWNGRMARDDAEPLIFVDWLRRLNLAIYGDDLGEDAGRFSSLKPLFIHFVLSSERGAAWCDDRRTPAVETCRQLLETTLMATIESLSRQFGDEPNDWRWGDVHKARFDHALFGAIPGLAWLANLSIETDGGEDTINQGGIRPWDARDPYAHVHGAGFRGVYDLADLRGARFVIATGQSGHILSPHYRGMMQLWRNGGFIMLGKSYEAMNREARLRIALVPR